MQSKLPKIGLNVRGNAAKENVQVLLLLSMDGSIQVICPDSIQIGPRKENAVVHVTKVTGEGPAECLLSLPKRVRV